MERVNLSSRPFTNHRLFWMGVLTVVIICIFSIWSISEQKSLAAGEIDRINASLKGRQLLVEKMKEAEEARKKADDQIFLTPQDQVQLAGARQLISRRVFSWDKLMSDLEGAVPSKAKIVGVKVSNLKFGVDGPVAEVDINALGNKASELTEMMATLDKTGGLFTVGEVSQSQMNDSGQIPFNLAVQYSPTRGGR